MGDNEREIGMFGRGKPGKRIGKKEERKECDT